MDAVKKVLEHLMKADTEIRLIPTPMMTHSPRDNALREIAEAIRLLKGDSQ